MKALCDFSATRVRRSAMTLVEIMAAVMVLSIGLVGVLAAIPFGGFRMSQMQEADSSAALGRNAAREIRSNGWANPGNWCDIRNRYGEPIPSLANTEAFWIDNDFVRLNLKHPFFIDPIGRDVPGSETPEYNVLFPGGGYNAFFTRIQPWIPDTIDLPAHPLTKFSPEFERVFYLRDDLNYGYAASEDPAALRPTFAENRVVGDGDAAPFSGRYTWMASITANSSSEPFWNCSASSVDSADIDVVVFDGRIPGEETAFAVTMDGSGYQGGVATLDLTTAIFRDGDGATDVKRTIDRFATTRYLMLCCQDDVHLPNAKTFAKWYKIASYSVEENDFGVPIAIRATLVGPSLPIHRDLAGNVVAAPITALFFPGAIGVYSTSETFTVDSGF